MNARKHFAIGCLFWPIGVTLLLLFIISLVASSVFVPWAEAQRDNAAANRAEEEADLVSTQSDADILEMYARVSIKAIEADTNAAHPVGWVVSILFDVLKVIAVVVGAMLILLVVIYVTNPDDAVGIIETVVGIVIAFKMGKATPPEPELESEAEYQDTAGVTDEEDDIVIS